MSVRIDQLNIDAFVESESQDQEVVIRESIDKEEIIAECLEIVREMIRDDRNR
ncbi:MAG: hypothetical protein MI784_03435 [Cytophagales bacterium]|nr:hypothetical protein [Cytophagales bacterium]